MNILFYIPELSQEWGGVRQYAVALLKVLSQAEEHTYFIYHGSGDPEVLDVLANNPQFILVKPDPAPSGTYYNKAKKLISLITKKRFETTLDKACKKYAIDIIHCPYQYLPESVYAKSVCTMHDVQELHFPEYFSAEVRADRAVSYLHYIRKADRIMVSYEHIKNDIIKYFGRPAADIDVCLLEMDKLWIDKYGPNDLTSLDFLHIGGDFLFYPANTWAHKNHMALLKAIIMLKEQGHEDMKVVCSGHKNAYFDDTLKPFVEDYNLQDQVIFAGILEENILYNLYMQCRGVVIPTLYEAGSFPLMESILLKVPVICSNVTSLPETIGDPDFTFNPNDVSEISNRMLQLWSDKDFMANNLANCEKQSYRLKHTNAVNIIRDTYKAIKQ